MFNLVCGRTYDNQEEGSFNSPGYPDNYDSDINCWWTINAQEGYVVKIDFVALHVCLTVNHAR